MTAVATIDPYENVRKRAVSQLSADQPMAFDGPGSSPVTSPTFKNPVSVPVPSQPGMPTTPQIGQGGGWDPGGGSGDVPFGDPSAPPPSAPFSAPVPTQPGMPTSGRTTYAPWTGPMTVHPSGIVGPFGPSGMETSSPTEGVPPVAPLPQPGGSSPTEGLPPIQRVAVPEMNYSMGATTADQPTSTAPTAGKVELPTSTQNNSASGDDEAAVRGFYQTYLHRDALPDDPQKWLTGAYGYGTDLASIEDAIRNSPEAKNYLKNAGAPQEKGGPTGDYSTPAAWRGLVGNRGTLVDWVKQQKQGLSDAEANSWADYIQKQPGQNDQEQTGADAYWRQWIVTGKNPVGGVEGGGSPSGKPSVAPPSTTPVSSGPTTPTGTTPFQDEIRKQIMARLKAAGEPVDQNAAGISDAVASARDDATRAGEQERTALAERLYAQGGGGLDSNALTQQIQQSGERTAQQTGGMRATLIMQEYSRKQNGLDQLLSMATASGDAEAARQIQIFQAELQAQLQREGISADLAKYAAYLNQNAALSGLHG